MKKAVIFSDGASSGNPGPSGIGAVIKTADSSYEISENIGTATNNMAEYRALIAALKKASDLGIDEITIHLDSELLVRQINGQYKVKSKGLIPLFMEVMKLLKRFRCYNIYHVPREENKKADMLAKNASLQKAT
ncbi:14.7 kDa ribonuclease H-like protein [bacterium BMS3Abin07]|nr:14.7 kDa ribonuclease H-like protein [bacterium BMS3Abin07]GBE32271.1 14.7 kDa ribonuclease H-like protein [bacterium BMS3Bbin05]HDO22818.1 ribonuclease HI family protein [Nitrospirota bacterium]HDZ88742.1 ribonuclease HI family protein [Nitrospirota bacterium]